MTLASSTDRPRWTHSPLSCGFSTDPQAFPLEIHRNYTPVARCLSTGTSATVVNAGGVVAATPRLADSPAGADMPERTSPTPSGPPRRSIELRSMAISDWWRHVAEGRCTLDEALDATAAQIAALEEERRSS